MKNCKPTSFTSSTSKLTFEELLLQLCLGNLNLNSLVDLLVMAALVVGIVLDRGREEGVDECGLSASRLASNLYDVSLEKKIPDFNEFTMIVKAAPRFATILCLRRVRLDQREEFAQSIPLVRELESVLSARVHHLNSETLTLAMPIGDADSAMVLRFVQRWICWRMMLAATVNFRDGRVQLMVNSQCE